MQADEGPSVHVRQGRGPASWRNHRNTNVAPGAWVSVFVRVLYAFARFWKAVFSPVDLSGRSSHIGIVFGSPCPPLILSVGFSCFFSSGKNNGYCDVTRWRRESGLPQTIEVFFLEAID